MGSHLVGFFESIDQAVLGAVNGIRDDVLTYPSLDRFQIPTDYNSLHAAAALGVNCTRAQIVTPSLEVKRASLEVIPHERGTIAFNLDSIRTFIPPKEIVFDPTENIELHISEDVGGVDALYGLISLKAPGALPDMPAGDLMVVRSTSANALTANIWSTQTLTPDKDLPAGEYSLVGFLPISATGIAARALLTGHIYRPGVPVLAGAEEAARDFDVTTLKPWLFYDMGRFNNLQFPQFQFLASAADAAQVVILYVIKVS